MSVGSLKGKQFREEVRGEGSCLLGVWNVSSLWKKVEGRGVVCREFIG